jgi:hypothetical protein
VEIAPALVVDDHVGEVVLRLLTPLGCLDQLRHPVGFAGDREIGMGVEHQADERRPRPGHAADERRRARRLRSSAQAPPREDDAGPLPVLVESIGQDCSSSYPFE